MRHPVGLRGDDGRPEGQPATRMLVFEIALHRRERVNAPAGGTDTGRPEAPPSLRPQAGKIDFDLGERFEPYAFLRAGDGDEHPPAGFQSQHLHGLRVRID